MIQIITNEAEIKGIIKEAFEWALDNMPQKKPSPEVLIVDEERLCENLGVTRQTLARWRKQGRIPFIQAGGMIRYDFHKVIGALEKKKGGSR